MIMSGRIYIISSPSMKYGYFKIGRTSKSKKELLSQYKRAYGEPRLVFWSRQVKHSYVVERRIHEMIAKLANKDPIANIINDKIGLFPARYRKYSEVVYCNCPQNILKICKYYLRRL
jgi:hypothetical protein